MIFQMDINNSNKLEHLLDEVKKHPVIMGVISGTNRGRIYVDDLDQPNTALIWAINEMFYLIGNHNNETFNLEVEQYIIDHILPEASEIGEENVNLEMYPLDKWNLNIKQIFRKIDLQTGERVPFVFQRDHFFYEERPLPTGYQLLKITDFILKQDKEGILSSEIEKFWPSLSEFLEKGLGYCVLKDQDVVGTCISAFVYQNEYEIGINTYQTQHRGKGLASIMACTFIEECISIGGTPHWTTEDFRKDSVAIANKLGFKQLDNYEVYYFTI